MTQGSYPIRDKSDRHNFIGQLLNGNGDRDRTLTEDEAITAVASVVVTTTIRKKYTVDDFRNIQATPSHVLASYDLNFVNDQVTVTVKVIQMIDEALKETV